MLKPFYILGRDALPRELVLREGESAKSVLVALPGSDASADLEVRLEGRGASLDFSGLYLCTGSERLSLNVTVRHLCGECTSRQLFKGIAGGSAKVGFGGLVYVAHGAQKTKASQENHNILLSADADVQTKPQLEIYADDVECSHGATTGFLRSDELFYMQSRGIPFEEARRLQLISFLAPVMKDLPEDIVERITAAL